MITSDEYEKRIKSLQVIVVKLDNLRMIWKSVAGFFLIVAIVHIIGLCIAISIIADLTD